MSEFNHLIALTKLHISQHYGEKSWIYTDPDTLANYREFAQRSKKAAPKQLPEKPRPLPRIAEPVRKQPIIKKTEPPALELPKEVEQRITPKPVNEVDFSDLIKIVKTHFPAQKILDSQPDDARAKETAQKWKHPAIPPEVWILDSSRAPEERLFLENIAQAIDLYFYPAAVLPISKMDEEPAPRLILGTKDLLNGIKAPSIAMESISFYLETPKEKSRLWKDLKNTLQSS